VGRSRWVLLMRCAILAAALWLGEEGVLFAPVAALMPPFATTPDPCGVCNAVRSTLTITLTLAGFIDNPASSCNTCSSCNGTFVISLTNVSGAFGQCYKYGPSTLCQCESGNLNPQTVDIRISSPSAGSSTVLIQIVDANFITPGTTIFTYTITGCPINCTAFGPASMTRSSASSGAQCSGTAATASFSLS